MLLLLLLLLLVVVLVVVLVVLLPPVMVMAVSVLILVVGVWWTKAGEVVAAMQVQDMVLQMHQRDVACERMDTSPVCHCTWKWW